MNAADNSPAAANMRPLLPLNAKQAAAPMTDTPISKTLRDIALEWLLRVQQAPQDETLRAALAHWLNAAPEHAAAYQKAQRAWQLTGQLAPATAAQWPLDAATSPAVAVLKPRRRWPQTAAIGLAACLLIALAPSLWLRLQADYRTGFAEQRQVELADGSVVRLDAASAITVSYSAQRRDIKLLRGQAFFEVKPDATRPFHVQAGDVDVRVTGTAFNVAVRPDGETVAVDHGSVQVRDVPGNTLLSPSLTAGQTLSTNDHQRPPTLSQVPVSQVAAWRNRQLIANNERLGDVVQALQRYVPGKVILSDPALADKRITGLYDLNHPAQALQAMLQPHGGKLDTYSDYLWVISR